MTAPARRDELAANLAAVRARIDTACRAAGRDPAGVRLIAVTKTWPDTDVAHLVDLGVLELGENRDAEAARKAAAAAEAGLVGIRWHFVGQVQTNKARSVARYADVVHSVDRSRLVRTLSAGAVEAGREVGALIQVDLGAGTSGPDAARGGAAPAEVPDLADAIASAAALRLLGVMAVAPRGAPPEPAFARLAEVAAALRAAHPEATWISAGMSGDLEVAVGAGATHVRVGSGVLGNRPFAR